MIDAARSAAPRLYLNHDVSKVAAEALRREGYDVVAAEEVAMEAASDEEHLLRAAAEGRTLVSFNVGDYCELHVRFLREGRSHWGIALSKQRGIRDTIRSLRRLLTSRTVEDLRNQLLWV